MSTEPSSHGSDAVAEPAGPTPTLVDIRRQPEHFIVDTGPAGIEHLCLEVVANSVDEFNAGHATNVAIAIGEDGSIFVRDDGRGIPVDPLRESKRSALETAFLEPGAGPCHSSDGATRDQVQLVLRTAGGVWQSGRTPPVGVDEIRRRSRDRCGDPVATPG